MEVYLMCALCLRIPDYAMVGVHCVDRPRRGEKPRSHNQQLRINFLRKGNGRAVQAADATVGYLWKQVSLTLL